MSHQNDVMLSAFHSKKAKSGKAHFTAFPKQREKQGKAGKAERFTREVLFRSLGKASPESGLFSPKKQLWFSRTWEKQKSAKTARNSAKRNPSRCPHYALGVV